MYYIYGKREKTSGIHGHPIKCRGHNQGNCSEELKKLTKIAPLSDNALRKLKAQALRDRK